ncbi:MAG: hypothetical protein KOO69_08895, partial [Victivallales bacterium]|nr:hypothetical protein [Victivallales bacterium]
MKEKQCQNSKDDILSSRTLRRLSLSVAKGNSSLAPRPARSFDGSLYRCKAAPGTTCICGENINPVRSNDVQKRIAKKLEPGAIGNGQPLLDLVKGKLPELIIECKQSTIDKIREATDLCIKQFIEKKSTLHPDDIYIGEDTSKNLIDFQANLLKKLHLFNAVVEGPEDYLLGFSYNGRVGLSLELVETLSIERLAQYIFHECAPEEGEYHRRIYKEIQPKIFGEDEVVALGADFRNFITAKRPSYLVDFSSNKENVLTSIFTPELLQETQHINDE